MNDRVTHQDYHPMDTPDELSAAIDRVRRTHMSDSEKWFRVYDNTGDMTLMRGKDYNDAAQQVVTIRRRQGKYRDVAEYNTFLMLIGGPLNPVRIEVFELTDMSNGTILEAFRVVLDDDALAREREKAQASMSQGGTSFSGRFG